MKVDPELCIACEECVPYCPMGRKSAADAARDLARQCDCGIFNPIRAAKLLAAMANK